MGEPRPLPQLGADQRLHRRELRPGGDRALPLGRPLADLERAQPAALAAPTEPRVYTQRLLNPAYDAIKEQNPDARVAGGVTAPRGNPGGVSPLGWIRGMEAANARLDAFAHNPYRLPPQEETPFTGGCPHCLIGSMAELARILNQIERSFGDTRVWLTEWAYQTDPPEEQLGVPPATQARYVAEASLRAWLAPRVDYLIHFMVRDDTAPGRWPLTRRDRPT